MASDRDGRREGAGAGEGASGPDDVDDVTTEEIALSPFELLASLARLDLEAAMAYEACAEAAGGADPALVAQLSAFGQDHRRHVDAVNAYLRKQGEEAVPNSADTDTALLAGLARLSAPLGPGAIVLTLLANEQLTNLSYEDALVYDWGEPEAEELLERHLADEQRHLAWLVAKQDEVSTSAEGPMAET